MREIYRERREMRRERERELEIKKEGRATKTERTGKRRERKTN